MDPKEINVGRNMDNMYSWRKKTQKRYEFYVNKETEKDVYEWLESQDNKRQYLIDLIKGDMNGHKEPTNEKS